MDDIFDINSGQKSANEKNSRVFKRSLSCQLLASTFAARCRGGPTAGVCSLQSFVQKLCATIAVELVEASPIGAVTDSNQDSACLFCPKSSNQCPPDE